MWITEPSISLEDIKYVKDINSEKILKILANVLNTDLAEDMYTPTSTRYRLCGITIELTPGNNFLNLKDTLEFVESTIDSITKNRDNDQLEDLYKATVLNAFIYALLGDHIFFKKEDKEMIKSKLVNVDAIRTYLSRLNHGEDNETLDLEDLDERTVAVLKSTLEELGYVYVEKNNKSYTNYSEDNKNTELHNEDEVERKQTGRRKKTPYERVYEESIGVIS